MSIKNAERKKRKEKQASVIRLKDDRGSTKTPKQFKKFLSVGKNKENLIQFFFDHWKTLDPRFLQAVELYFAHGCECHKFKASGPDLIVESVNVSDHEEADTRMALHAFHAFQPHEEVTIQSDDTNVLVVCLGLNKMFSGKLYILRGTAVNLRTLNIKSVVSNLPDGVVEALLGLHPFTGCDSVSCWKRKRKSYSIQTYDYKPVIHICAYHSWAGMVYSNVPIDVLEQFLCQLYY